MKTKWKSRKRPVRLLCLALASMLAAGSAIAALMFGGTARAAEPLDLDRTCKLQVKAEPQGLEADKEEAPDVVVDLYRVADARKMDGYDAYTFENIDPFGDLDFDITVGGTDDKDIWIALAQEAAEIIFAEGSAVSPTETATKAEGSDVAEASNLEPGLYLMVPRGTGMEQADYLVRETDEATGTETIRTIAYSDSYTFTYSPQLVALPAREALEDGTIATSNQTEWIYDMTGLQAVQSKPELSERFGTLRIDKELMSYHTGSPATFVYTVEATLRGQTVYSNAVSLTFNGPGIQSEWIEDRIPVGAEVTVTEIYSGAAYRAVAGTPTTQAVTMDNIGREEAGFDNIAAFRNEYDGTGRNGSSITNHFEYGYDADGYEVWNWIQIPAAE